MTPEGFGLVIEVVYMKVEANVTCILGTMMRMLMGACYSALGGQISPCTHNSAFDHGREPMITILPNI